MKRRAFVQTDDMVLSKITTEGCLVYRSIVAIAVGDLLRFKTLTSCNAHLREAAKVFNKNCGEEKHDC